MSEFHVQVVRIGKVEKHPNADSLSTTLVHGGYPVVFKTGTYQEGDLAVYLPLDAVVPDRPYYEFLAATQKDRLPGDPIPEKYRRIKAKKLRGVFSMGMLVPLSEISGDEKYRRIWHEGDDVQEAMGVTKWEPDNVELQALGQARERGVPSWYERIPWWRRPFTRYFWRRLYWRIKRGNETTIKVPPEFHEYTDMEGFRKHRNAFELGEEVILTEKIHGANFRAGWCRGTFYVGSHHRFYRKPKDGHNWWWDAALAIDLEKKLKNFPDLAFYGEVYGKTQKGFGYDVGADAVGIRFFDVKNLKTGLYLDYDDFVKCCQEAGLETAPVLYRGPWKPELTELAEGQTTLGKHVREGWVGRPAKERIHPAVGRLILKCVGEGYHLARAA